MAAFSEIRKIRREGETSEAINLGDASEHIERLEAGRLAQITVLNDKIVIDVLNYDEPEYESIEDIKNE